MDDTKNQYDSVCLRQFFFFGCTGQLSCFTVKLPYSPAAQQTRRPASTVMAEEKDWMSIVTTYCQPRINNSWIVYLVGTRTILIVAAYHQLFWCNPHNQQGFINPGLTWLMIWVQFLSGPWSAKFTVRSIRWRNQELLCFWSTCKRQRLQRYEDMFLPKFCTRPCK